MRLARTIKHLCMPDWLAHRPFSTAVVDRIEAAVRKSESLHGAELRVALEAGLHPAALLRGLTPRARALEVFSELRVWDTEHNSGVLLYLQLVDRSIEIVADRGIHARVPQAQWQEICRRIEAAFAQGQFEKGVLAAIEDITALLAQHFPPAGARSDELEDRPAML
ncbi:MAG TPA: TPM domain-containing protein [Burkholderiales bacterium]